MISKKFIVFILITLSFESFSQKTFKNDNYQITTTPGWVISHFSTDSIKNLYNNTNTQVKYLLSDYQYNKFLKTKYIQFVFRINNQTGIQNAFPVEILFDPSYEKLYFHKINIIRDKKSFNKISDDNIKVVQREKDAERNIMNGNLSALINIDDIRVGDLIQIEYSIEGENPIFENIYNDIYQFESQVDVDKFYFSCILDTIPLKYSFTKNTFLPKISKENKKIKYEWKIINSKAIELEDYMPTDEIPFNTIYLTQYKNWKEVNVWIKKLFTNGKINENSIDEIISFYKNKSESLEDLLLNIIRFVQNDVRYQADFNGIYSHKPHNPNFVLDKRFGDCKDKVNLFLKICQKIDIQAYPVLVNSFLRGNIIKDHPSPFSFDHVIATYKFKNKDYFVDLTIPNQKGGLENNYCPSYTNGLKIDSISNSLLDIPLNSFTGWDIYNYYEPYLNKTPTYININSNAYGYDADLLRMKLNSDISRFEHEVYQESMKMFGAISQIDKIRFFDDQIDNKLLISEKYISNSFVQFNEDSSQIILAFSPNFILKNLFIPSKSENRKFDLGLPMYHSRINETVEINLPFDLDTSAFLNEAINSEYLKFKFEIKHLSTQRHILKYFLHFPLKKVPVAAIPAFLENIKKIDKIMVYSVRKSIGGRKKKKKK